MTGLDGFLTTWSQARDTYGQGTPQSGADYDQSVTIEQLGSTVESANPKEQWTGAAATGYGTDNSKRALTLRSLGGLDRQLKAQIDASGTVVANGRQNLDTIRQWVLDAASTVPNTAAGDQLKNQIAAKGLSQLIQEIERTNGDLSDIGRQVKMLGDQYQTIGDDFSTFGPEEAPEGEGDPEAEQQQLEEQAQKDVHDTLNGGGDPNAVTRVENTLNSIQPGQPLSAEQSAYLSQMQIQQKGMTLQQLHDAEERLGEQGHVIGDSWQLMSDTDVQLNGEQLPPEVANDPVAKADYYKQKLPDSVIHALDRDSVNSWREKFDPLGVRTDNAHEVSMISDIVRDGQDRFQQGTALDDAMLDWSREAMADPTQPTIFSPLGLDDYDGYASARDDALADVFNTAGVDHQAVSAELGSNTGQQFLTELHTHVWAETPQMVENQQSTHSLLSWIADEAHSPNEAVATRAGVAAHALAVNLDANHDLYLKPEGVPGLGPSPNAANLNPSLIAADAIALEPYQDALVGDSRGVKGFDSLGNFGDGDLSAARNVFAVIDSDPGAAQMFNAAAEEKILAHQQAYAEAAAAGLTSDTDPGDLKRSAYLLGAVNGGAEMEAAARGLQGDELNQAVYNAKKAGLDYLFGQIPGTGNIPGFDITRDIAERGILGAPPDPSNPDTVVPTYSPQHAINSTYYQMGNAMDLKPGDIDPVFFNPDGSLMSPNQMDPGTLDRFSTAMENYLIKRDYQGIGANIDRWYRQAEGG